MNVAALGTSETDWTWDQAASAWQGELPDAPYDTWRSRDGDRVVEFRRRGPAYLARFIDAADFKIDTAARRVTAVPVPDLDPAALEDLYFNQVIPVLLGHSGRPVIHASAVGIGECGTAFMGMTGQGKSTLAAALANAGHPFLTDDGLILAGQPSGGFLAGARRPQVRLRADSEAMLTGGGEPALNAGGAKRRVSAGPALPFHARSLPLKTLYWLPPSSAPDGIRIDPVEPGRALDLILQHGFFLDVEYRPSVRRAFEQAAAVAASVPCFALDYPRDYDALPAVVSAIVAHASRR